MPVVSRRPAPERAESLCVSKGCGALVKGKRRCRRCYQRAWHKANKATIRMKRKNPGNSRRAGSRVTIESMLSMALASVKRTEALVARVETYLGLKAPELQRDDLSVLKLVDELMSPIERGRVLDPDYLRHWCSVLFRVDEAYVKSVGKILNSPEPWTPFCDFAKRVTHALYYEERGEARESSEELDFAQRCFGSAYRHISAIAYRIATSAAERKTAVEELDEFLMSPSQAEKPDRRALRKGGSTRNAPLPRGCDDVRRGIQPLDPDAEAPRAPRPLRRRRGEGGGGNVMH
jgi:hypothetical protein